MVHSRDPTKKPCVPIIFILESTNSWFYVHGCLMPEARTQASNLTWCTPLVFVLRPIAHWLGKKMAVGAQTPPPKTTGKGLFTMIGSPPMWQTKREVSLDFQYHATGQLSNLSHERIDKGPTSTNLLIHTLLKLRVQVWNSMPHIMCWHGKQGGKCYHLEGSPLRCL